MGLLFYLEGDVEKAHYYHSRFMNNQAESDSSPCKITSQKAFEKILEYKKMEGINLYHNTTEQINLMVLTKLGLNLDMDKNTNKTIFQKKSGIDELIEENPLFHKETRKKKQQKVEFFTKMSIGMQLESIFAEREFIFDIGSPLCYYFYYFLR